MKDNGSSESDEWKSRYDKLKAEFKDYIERSRREEEAKMAELRVDLAKKLLPVADSLARVSAIYENSNDNNGCEVIRSYSENIRKNIEVIHDQLLSAMSITPIEPAAGDKFDDRLHTAVGLEYGTIYPANSVFRVIRRGYRVGDNIVRPAEVIVSKRPLEAPAVRKARKAGLRLLERIARRVRPTKHRLIALNQRMDEFEHAQTDKLERLIQDVSTLKTKLEAGNQRLNELESTRAGAEEIAVIKEEIASLRAIIKELESRAEKVEGLAQDINSLRTTLEELEGRIAPLPLQGEVQSKYPSQETGYLKSGE